MAPHWKICLFVSLAAFFSSHTVLGLTKQVKGMLVGIADSGGQIDLVSLNPFSVTVTPLFKNVTSVSVEGVTPQFSTAYCTDTGNFLVAINDMGAPRVVGVDLNTGKVLGVIKVNGVFVDNLECDLKTGFGMAYVFQLGFKHTLVKLDFAKETHEVLMSSSYKSYGGSAIDPVNERLFTVAVLPHLDAFNYSVSVLHYQKNTENASPPFEGYSIGDMVYDAKIQQPLAIVQTPPQYEEGPEYKIYLARLELSSGTVKKLAGPWSGQQPIRATGVTLDAVKRIAYSFTRKYITAVHVDTGKVLYMKSTASLPFPVIYYQFIY